MSRAPYMVNSRSEGQRQPPPAPPAAPAPPPPLPPRPGRWVSQAALDMLENLYDRAADSAEFADGLAHGRSRTASLRKLKVAVDALRAAGIGRR